MILSEPTIDSFLHPGSDWVVFSSIYYVDTNIGVSPVMSRRTCASVCACACVRVHLSHERWEKEGLAQGHTLAYTNMKCVVAVHIVTGDDVAQNAYCERVRRCDVIDGVGSERTLLNTYKRAGVLPR